MLSGVPQDTVLIPLLFWIIIADINKDISESNLISFADDTRIYTQIHDVSDCNLLQQDLNHIYDWATTNNMFFNAQKFHYITFSSKESSCLSNVYINPKLNIKTLLQRYLTLVYICLVIVLLIFMSHVYIKDARI